MSNKFHLNNSGEGKHVIILGAGLAGMASAYELSKYGYKCTMIEARDRVGGRCWTIRGEEKIIEINGSEQVAKFAEGHYLNAGPARIPQHHVTLDYCKELNVQLEVLVNSNRNQYFYHEDVGLLSNRKVRAKEAIADIRGYISELLTKATKEHALDEALTYQNKERLIEFLKIYGELNESFYKGTTRRGYSVPPGAGHRKGIESLPYDLSALLQLSFAEQESFEYSALQQMTMLQPVGGMDRIAKAFESKFESIENITLKTNAQVKEIRNTPTGVRIIYQDISSTTQEVQGDYCICTIPLTVLRYIPSDFSPQMKDAIASVSYTCAGKSGLQFKKRFWEDEQIYGGITRTNLDIEQIWYPSYGYQSNKGVIVGYYNTGAKANAIGTLPPVTRLDEAIKQGEKIHPQYRECFEHGVSVYWNQIPYSLGGWADYTDETRKMYYPILNQRDGNIYLAGEHLSYITGWMAGAFESARAVVQKIDSNITFD